MPLLPPTYARKLIKYSICPIGRVRTGVGSIGGHNSKSEEMFASLCVKPAIEHAGACILSYRGVPRNLASLGESCGRERAESAIPRLLEVVHVNAKVLLSYVIVLSRAQT